MSDRPTGPGTAGHGVAAGGEAAAEARIGRGDVRFGPRDAALLAAIDEHGSLAGAAAALDRSFAHAQRRVVELEGAFGDLVERRRGGAGGGGSDLTPGAWELLGRFERLRAELVGVARSPETVVEGRVVARGAGVATVETPAGRLSARAAGDADRVEVAVRADAVTLHAPADAPADSATSARNRLAGEVATVEPREDDGTVVVEVAVGGGVRLAALVTPESVDRLDLAPGRPVVATWKATATRALAVD